MDAGGRAMHGAIAEMFFFQAFINKTQHMVSRSYQSKTAILTIFD
jgi:hypothetical protein